MAATVQIEIVGLMNKHNFQIAKGLAEGLKTKFRSSFDDPLIRPLLECDWHVYLSNKKRELKGEVWKYTGCLMCFVNGELIGDERKLSSWAEKEWKCSFHRPQALYKALAEEYYIQNLQATGHIFVYMDIDIGGEAAGRLMFELFSELCPKTCRNFKALCNGEATPDVANSNVELNFKDSIFHRVVPNGWVQGGDIYPGRKGSGGESIYGPTFEDENFVVSHNKRGILGMANKGPHSNGSQFYITLQPASWMDYKYVAFGQLVEGTEVLKRLEEVPTYNERPKQDCKIITCGVIEH